MQEPWFTSARQARTSQPSVPLAATSEALSLGAEALLQRLVEMEGALGVQEWWLLGRSVVEAQPLAEVASLLAVARGELENFLAEFFAHPLQPEAEPADGAEDMTEDVTARLDDSEWIGARQEEARALLDMAAAALPAMQREAGGLRESAERLSMASAALDALGIICDRLAEAAETLHLPPRPQ
jgi:hypothetical protein